MKKREMEELRQKIFGDSVYINLDVLPERKRNEVVETREEEMKEYMDELEQELFWDYYNKTIKKGS
jgi:hypothetical protein